MITQSGKPGQEKLVMGWREYDANRRNRWLFGGLTLASFLTLQTIVSVGPNDIALTVAFLALTVVLPLNALVVLLTYATKEFPETVRRLVAFIAAAGTFLGIDAAFWHASWSGGIVFTTASVIAGAVAGYYLYPREREPEVNELW